MIPDNVTTAPVFITFSPDWSARVRFWQSWQTNIAMARSSAEQRAAMRSFPRYSIAYLKDWDESEWPVRRSGMIREFGAPVVVPCWPRSVGFVSEADNVVELDVVTLANKAFKAASYAHFEEAGLASVFRLIDEVGETSITLASGNAAYPDIAVPAYTAAALVRPCILGMRQKNQAEWNPQQLDSTTETVFVEEF